MKYVWILMDFNDASPDCAYTTKKAVIREAKRLYKSYGSGLKFNYSVPTTITVSHPSDLEWLCVLHRIPVIHSKRK